MYDAIIFTDNNDSTTIQISAPLGAFKVACVLRKNGYKTLVVNHISTFSLNEIKDLIDLTVSDQTKLLGFSTTFLKTVGYARTNFILPQGKEFEDEVISYIRSKNKNIKFAVGGSKTSNMYDNKNIDYVVLGYSEISIVNLLNHLTNGDPLNNAMRNLYGITIIDDRTASGYDFSLDKMIWEETDVVNHKVLPIETGRGCIFKCKFCSYPLNGKNKLDYIKESDILYQELLENYEKFGVTHYIIVDDTFNDSEEKLNTIADMVKRLPFKPYFWCYSRLDLICVRPEIIHTMHEIGIRSVYFGIETMNEKTGRIIGKGYNREKQTDMISMIRNTYQDISMHGSFIMGLPDEPVNSLVQTATQLARGEIPLHSWMTRALYINQDLSFLSDIDLNYEKYGYKVTTNDLGQRMWTNQHLNSNIAARIATHCNKSSRDKSYFKVSGHDLFELVNHGYTLDEARETAFKDFRYDLLSTQAIPKFIQEYKTKLLSLLKKK